MDLINKATPRYNVFNEQWEFISDSVMGGISSGELKIVNDENILYYKLFGHVSTDNNGGFIQFRSKIKLNEHLYLSDIKEGLNITKNTITTNKKVGISFIILKNLSLYLFFHFLKKIFIFILIFVFYLYPLANSNHH